MAEPAIYLPKRWFDSYMKMPEDTKKDIFYYVVNYSLTGEIPEDNGDTANCIALNIIQQMDLVSETYEGKCEQGAKGGRPPNANNDLIKEYARMGMKPKEISEKMGMSVKSVYNSKGWRERDK